MKSTKIFALLAPSLTMIFCCFSISRAAPVTFDWATVGNAGNAGEEQQSGLPSQRGTFGAVATTYRISKTEVTNVQYTEFLNSVDPAAANSLGLFNPSMAGDFGGIELQAANAAGSRFVSQAGRENNPVTYVSWYDSVRFINWLNSGQGTGDTESGAYTLAGGTSTPTNGSSITRNANATYWLPSENEWYKAAYHDASAGLADTYFRYANGSDTIPTSNQPGDDPSAANYLNNDFLANGFNDGYAVSGHPINEGPNPFTDVGAYSSAVSSYGTYDQNGNVSEWNETLVTPTVRGSRGGSWGTGSGSLIASFRASTLPTSEFSGLGFRVASLPGEATLAGDFDNDDDVDGADFLAWQRDQSVGALSDWESTFGTTGLPITASTSVPEPSSGILLLLGVTVFVSMSTRSLCVAVSWRCDPKGWDSPCPVAFDLVLS